LNNILIFENFSFKDVIDILLVAIIIYAIYNTIAKTRALPVLRGVLIIIILTVLAIGLKLETLRTIFEQIVSLMFITVIILFPSEIRHALYKLGQIPFLGDILKVERISIIDIIAEAAQSLVESKTGALMVIERNDHLQTVIDSGTFINSEVKKNLIIALFQKKSPLHDGAIVIRRDRIISAGSYISFLSSSETIAVRYGSRHRAALGLSEQSDALVIIVSEEEGTVSLAHQSKMYSDLTTRRLMSRLEEFTSKQTKSIKIKKPVKSP